MKELHHLPVILAENPVVVKQTTGGGLCVWFPRGRVWRLAWSGPCADVLRCAVLTQSCPTLHGPMECSLPGSSARGILQARILEWVAMPSSGGSSQPRDRTTVSCTAGGFWCYQGSPCCFCDVKNVNTCGILYSIVVHFILNRVKH